MAGAGYKLFNTGDVLTAAQVNTYLMEQTVMVFADAAARTAALSGVVSEGMISYLKDTNAVEVYNGSAWVASDDPNAIQNTIVDAKGDLITATAADVPARLAVGNNGETLVADSSTSTGLRWQPDYAAGKNKFINGDFGIWQRGTTQSVIDNSPAYGSADRWLFSRNGTTLTGTNTVSRQTFTPGQTDVPNNPTYFCRWTVTTLATSQTRIDVNHYVEDVATFAGQTVTVSFYGKASTARSYELYLEQNFGSGGSTAVATLIGSGTITTGWTRLSVTGTLPSISGKTVGASNYLRLILRVTSVQTGDVFEFANAQLEAGNVATAFQTATGTLAGELAACQRYYWRSSGQAFCPVSTGMNVETTDSYFYVNHPVPMRTSPTTVDYSTLEVTDLYAYNTAVTNLVITANSSGRNVTQVQATHGANGTRYRVAFLRNANNTAGYLGFSAEL